ncbi:MAG: thiolase family protein [Deltaproteobacteria bacterium TMED126]|jgi:benzoylsuccinyl-CoA thiolase BbsB subunit|nr:thiolase family protein [Candidatus Dadabacteria bacterium]NSW97173.1 thiolase family protein [Deltaproteobacteria bacterium TMED126]|tara:strand:+ start:6373 stop:7539 length:1167 start_codon:yes stop_codon:yes gene_type:complete
MANLRDVYIIGVGQTPCGKFPAKAAHVLGREASWAAIKDAGIYARDIEIGFCGHVYQGMGVGQRTLKDIGLVGQPVINVEGACGSGTLSFWEAWRTIAFGQNDVALAWGVENLSKIMSGGPLPLEEDDIEVALGMSMPGLYAMRAKRYMDEYGVSAETLAKVVVKSRQHASKNPIAQFRKETTIEAVLADPVICDPLTRSMCCPVGDASAAAVLVSGDMLDKIKRDKSRMPIKVLGCVAQSGGYASATGLTCDPSENVGRTSQMAYEQAGLGPKDMDVVEIHDAFAIAELIVAEALGFAEKGEGARLIEEGKSNFDGDIAINPSGGLLSRGHPVGATGLLQTVEIVNQLRGEATGCQVPDANVGLIETMGGAQPAMDGITCVVSILGK